MELVAVPCTIILCMDGHTGIPVVYGVLYGIAQHSANHLRTWSPYARTPASHSSTLLVSTRIGIPSAFSQPANQFSVRSAGDEDSGRVGTNTANEEILNHKQRPTDNTLKTVLTNYCVHFHCARPSVSQSRSSGSTLGMVTSVLELGFDLLHVHIVTQSGPISVRYLAVGLFHRVHLVGFHRVDMLPLSSRP